MKEKVKNNSIAKNAFFKLLLNLFNVIVPIIIGPYVARKLGSDMLGTINFSQAMFSYFFIFAGFGIYNYGIREISRRRDNKEEVEKTFTSLFVITIITNLLTSCAYIFFIKSVHSGTEVYTASIILSFNFMFNIFYTEWVNEALESYDFISIKTIIVRIIYLILLLLLVKSVNDWQTYVYLLVLSNALNNVLSFIHIKRKIKFNFKSMEIIKHIKPMFFVVILSNANVLYTQLDKVMIGSLVNEKSVSFYTMAQNVMIIVNSTVLTLISVSLPRLSLYLSRGSEDEYLVLVNKLAKIFFWFLFPASMGIIVLAGKIMPLYGGVEFIPASSVLFMFGIHMLTLGYEYILSNQILYLKKKEIVQVKLLFAGGIINFILNIIFYKLGIFTPTTAVLTTAIANGVFVAMEYYYVKKIMKLDINLFSVDKTKYLILALGFVPIIFVVEKFIKSSVLVIIFGMISCVVFYYGTLILTRDALTMDMIKQGKIRITSLIEKLKNKK